MNMNLFINFRCIFTYYNRNNFDKIWIVMNLLEIRTFVYN